jgi:hypothetical protein
MGSTSADVRSDQSSSNLFPEREKTVVIWNDWPTSSSEGRKYVSRIPRLLGMTSWFEGPLTVMYGCLKVRMAASGLKSYVWTWKRMGILRKPMRTTRWRRPRVKRRRELGSRLTRQKIYNVLIGAAYILQFSLPCLNWFVKTMFPCSACDGGSQASV